MNDNNAMIIVHPDAVEVIPKERKVLAGIQTFKLGIDWSDNQNAWEYVTVSDFVRVRDHSPVEIETHAAFRKGETFVREIRFRSIERRTSRCGYHVTCGGLGKPMTRTFDLLLLAPGGGDDAGPSTEGEEEKWAKTIRSSTFTQTSSS